MPTWFKFSFWIVFDWFLLVQFTTLAETLNPMGWLVCCLLSLETWDLLRSLNWTGIGFREMFPLVAMSNILLACMECKLEISICTALEVFPTTCFIFLKPFLLLWLLTVMSIEAAENHKMVVALSVILSFQ